MVPDFWWFELWFSDFRMVQKQYPVIENHTWNFEIKLDLFPDQEYAVGFSLIKLGRGSE
jgi:hypothetical protein